MDGYPLVVATGQSFTFSKSTLGLFVELIGMVNLQAGSPDFDRRCAQVLTAKKEIARALGHSPWPTGAGVESANGASAPRATRRAAARTTKRTGRQAPTTKAK